MPSTFVPLRLDADRLADLERIAARDFGGNRSAAIRAALDAFIKADARRQWAERRQVRS